MSARGAPCSALPCPGPLSPGSAGASRIGTAARRHGTSSKTKWLQSPCRADSAIKEDKLENTEKAALSLLRLRALPFPGALGDAPRAPRPAALLPWPAQPLDPADPAFTGSERTPIEDSPLMFTARQVRSEKPPTVL